MGAPLREFFRRFVAVYLVTAPVLALLLFLWVPHQVIGGLFLLHGVLFIPALMPNGALFGPIQRRFATQEKEVLLTLDDGPDPQTTPQVLALLAAYEARVCFFVIGEKVRAHPELARAIVAGGHELGNHTDRHREWWFWKELWGGVAREVDGCSQAIESATGRRPRWFRSPAGITNPYVYPVLRERGLRLLGWSGRACDAGQADWKRAATRLLKFVEPGAVLVLHPERKSPGGALAGLSCLEKVLVELRALGYRCVFPADTSA